MVDRGGLENRCGPTGPPWVRIPPSPLCVKSCEPAGSRSVEKRVVKEQDLTPWCGLHTRDRSVSAGRSHSLSAFSSLYVLLDSCQGIVGHSKQDFDTGAHLSGVYLNVTIVTFYLFTLYPIAPIAI